MLTAACQFLSDIWRRRDGTFGRFSVDSLRVDKASLTTCPWDCKGLYASSVKLQVFEK
jgi:hypothetical protein